MNIQSIYHININCTEFDRSFEFYKRLGFRPIVGPAKGGGGAINEQVLRLPRKARSWGVIMQLGDDPHCSHVDLIEWQEPRTEGRPYERLDHVGIARACFYSKNIWQDYATLRAEGVNFYSEPQIATYKTGQSAVVCFEDPDGTVLEMVQFQKSGAAPARCPTASRGPAPFGQHLPHQYQLHGFRTLAGVLQDARVPRSRGYERRRAVPRAPMRM